MCPLAQAWDNCSTPGLGQSPAWNIRSENGGWRGWFPLREGWVLFDRKDEWMLGRRNSRVQESHLQKGRGGLGWRQAKETVLVRGPHPTLGPPQ